MINFQDKNKKEPRATTYDIKVQVLDDPFIPIYEEIIEEIELEVKSGRKIDVTIGKPTNTGLLTIEFSDQVQLSSNITDWTNQNDGKDYLEIDYVPSDDTDELFEDYQIDMSFSWKINNVEEQTTS